MPRGRKRLRKAWSSPKDIKIADARRCIDEIASTLKKRDFKREVGIQVTEVFVGGSIGQGTTVPGRYDADLVIYSRDIDHKHVAKEGYKYLHDKLKKYLEEQLGSNYIPQDGTKFAIKFEYRFGSDDEMTIEVDLLLSPHWSSQLAFLRDLDKLDGKERQLFSASASKYQVKFIKYLYKTKLNISQNQSSKVIELIRRAKSWRNRNWIVTENERLVIDDRGRPKSYLICLLVIIAFAKVPYDRMPFNRLAERVGEEMKTLLNEITSDDQLDLVIRGTDLRTRERPDCSLPLCPRILDPANPFTNLYLNGVGPIPDSKEVGKERAKWGPFKEKIKSIDLTIKAKEDERNILSITKANRAVHTIVRKLHEGFTDTRDGTFTISEVVKGGSLGHGTAVRSNYDLDLVVYSDSLTGELVLEKGMDYWLTCLKRLLDDKLSRQISNMNCTSTFIEFKFEDYIDCDVFISPLWREPHLFYQFLQSIRFGDRMRFSVSASRWQVAFFKEQHNEVKELIKRAKAWRNQMWSGDSPGKPKSYLLSLLVLWAFEKAKQRLGQNPSFSQISHETNTVMVTMVRNHDNVDIYWEKYYKKDTYPDLFPKDPPRIVDPANPSNNLYYSGIAAPYNKIPQDYRDGGGKWDHMASLIDTLDLTNSIN